MVSHDTCSVTITCIFSLESFHNVKTILQTFTPILITGLDVHFIHVRPPPRADQRVLPLMLVHGWPGSFYEFYKILPLLTDTQDGLAFEVVCPSIPGYGYSEAPHKQGRDHTTVCFSVRGTDVYRYAYLPRAG